MLHNNQEGMDAFKNWARKFIKDNDIQFVTLTQPPRPDHPVDKVRIPQNDIVIVDHLSLIHESKSIK